MESQRSGGWFHGVGSECSSPGLDICRGFLLGVCPQSLRSQPSWPQTLATRAVPRHRPTSRPLCPDNSRRDAGIISAHCHRLIESGSEQNRSRQIAPTCPLPSNLPFRPKFRSRDANPVYRITSLEDLPLDFHSKLRIHDSSIFHSVQLFAPFFLFYGHGTRNYEGSGRITRFVSLSRPRDTTARAGNNGRLVKRSQRSACHALPESSIALLGASVGVARGRDGSVYERVCHGNTVVDTTPTLPFAAGQHQTSGCRAVSVAATPAFFDAIGSPRSVVTNLIISRTSLFALAGNGMRSSKKRGSRLL